MGVHRPFSTGVTGLAVLLILLCSSPVHSLFCGQDDCFELLGLKRNASKLEIRRAYRRLSSELHPDKRPNDPTAKESFRKLGNAYETLTDDAKRAKYEDFLDNPGKYWQFLMENAREVYAPKSNVIVVVSGIIGIMTLIHWLNMNHTYNETLRRMRESQEFKRNVDRLLKSKQAATREEAETMINLDVVGLQEPNWRNLIVFKMARLPIELAKYIAWNVKWLVSYKIRRCEYSDEDKKFLIRRNLEMSDEEWNGISEKDLKTYMDEEVWDKEKCKEYLRLKRIELNRLGKAKKKKKQTPIPYSEVEPVSLSD